MANYRDFRPITRALDDEGWHLMTIRNPSNSPQVELQRDTQLERVREGINLIFSSTNVTRGHWCLDSDNLLVTEYDEEEIACRCVGPAPATVERPLPLPF